MLVKLDHFPSDRGENRKHSKPPSSIGMLPKCWWMPWYDSNNKNLTRNPSSSPPQSYTIIIIIIIIIQIHHLNLNLIHFPPIAIRHPKKLTRTLLSQKSLIKHCTATASLGGHISVEFRIALIRLNRTSHTPGLLLDDFAATKPFLLMTWTIKYWLFNDGILTNGLWKKSPYNCVTVSSRSHIGYIKQPTTGVTLNTLLQLRTKSSFPTSSPLQPSDTSHEILPGCFYRDSYNGIYH